MSARRGSQATLAPVLRLALELLGYNLLLLAFLPAIAGWVSWRLLVMGKPIGRWSHRLGVVPRLPERAGPRIWVHAVSAGEMTAARPVIAELKRQFPQAEIALSTHTDTGMEVARRSCPEADALFYLPLDLPVPMGLAMLRLRPQLLVLVEKELWPNLLAAAHLGGAAVLAVNGRVSDRMVKRGRVVPTLVRRMYRLLDVICVQSDEDARRLRMLGVPGRLPRVVVAGNTKADTLAGRDREAEERLAAALGVSESDLWLVAGSTHPGEEEQVVEAFLAIQQELPSARLLLAPRHLERVPSVSAMIAGRGLSVVRRSEPARPGEKAVVVLDTMGELGTAYGFAAAAFVGGTLVAVGGHNLLEPTAVGAPVLFGPHTENCADTADLIAQARVGFRVGDGAALARAFVALARDTGERQAIARRAERLMAEQRGASSRCAAEAAGLLTKRGVGER